MVPAASLACFALALAGCGHMQVHEAVLRPAEAARARNGRAEVYLASQPPARPYYDVALVQAVGFGNDATLEDVTEALAARGGQLGCDAVVGVTVDQGASLAHAYGVCVRYAQVHVLPSREPSRASRPAPPPRPPREDTPLPRLPRLPRDAPRDEPREAPPQRPTPPEPDDDSAPDGDPDRMPM